MSMEECKYFFSYARHDSEFVLKLAKELRDAGVNLWLDQLDILGGQRWDRAVEGALKTCGGMIAVLSPESVASNSVMDEVSFALEEEKLVIPVILRLCEIPFRLRRLQHIDFTTNYEKGYSQLLRALHIEQLPPSPEFEPSSKAPPKPRQAKPVKAEIAKPKSSKPPAAKIGVPGGFTNSIGMEFVLIPPGTFLMGSRLSSRALAKQYGGKPSYYDGEHPQHQVILSRPFYLQTTPVTQGQWQRVMGNNPSDFHECGDDCPVESVSWSDAQQFIRKLNRLEKTDQYRLPTEAEWEYACRAGSPGEFCFGDQVSDLKEYAWYVENSETRMHPVGSRKPNAWGLYDMHGNVNEWCQDWYSPYPAGPVTNPQGPRSGEEHVIRGGNYSDDADSARSSYRSPFLDESFFTVGLRVARTV